MNVDQSGVPKLLAILQVLGGACISIYWIVKGPGFPYLFALPETFPQVSFSNLAGYTLAYLSWMTPFLLLGSFGIWRNRKWGWWVSAGIHLHHIMLNMYDVIFTIWMFSRIEVYSNSIILTKLVLTIVSILFLYYLLRDSTLKHLEVEGVANLRRKWSYIGTLLLLVAAPIVVAFIIRFAIAIT